MAKNFILILLSIVASVNLVDSSVNLSHFPLIRGELHHLEITADSPIGGRSWRLTAADVVEE